MKLAILYTLYASARIAEAASSSRLLKARERLADDDCMTQSTSLKSLTAFQTQLAYGNQTNGDDNVIEFRLYNPAIDVSTECSGHGTALNGSDPSAWYWCFVESRDPRITATFQFDATTSKLSVNETWFCDSRDNTQSIIFEALGSEILPLQYRNTTFKGNSQHQCTLDENMSIPISTRKKA